MAGLVLRARKNAGDPKKERSIRDLIQNMKEESENPRGKLRVAVEITRIPRMRKKVREYTLLENIAFDVSKTDTLIPLITDAAQESHVAFLKLGELLEGYTGRERAALPFEKYAENKIKALQRRLKVIMSLIKKDGEGRKDERLTADYRQAYEEMALMQRFEKLGHFRCVEEAERVREKAKEWVEMRMLGTIKQNNPDLILLHRYLKENDFFGYRRLRVTQITRVTSQPLRSSLVLK